MKVMVEIQCSFLKTPFKQLQVGPENHLTSQP